jgi:hypothetical protein
VQNQVENAIKQDVQNVGEMDLLFDNPLGKETYIMQALQARHGEWNIRRKTRSKIELSSTYRRLGVAFELFMNND